VVALLCFYPLGYYVGLVDAYMAHCLYSLNTPVAGIIRDGEEPQQIVELPPVHIPFPPAPRLFKAYFAKVAEPGERLLIRDFRRWAKARGTAEERFIKLAGGDGEQIAPLPRSAPGR
jgi:hypothetical protein